MNNTPPILLNVSGISAIPAMLLDNITIIPDLGVMLNYWRNFAYLPLASLARVEVASKVEDKCNLFTVSLSARLTADFLVKDRHLAFLISCVDGSKYLLGTADAPYPVANTSVVFPDKTSDVSGWQLTVEYTSAMGLLRVLD